MTRSKGGCRRVSFARVTLDWGVYELVDATATGFVQSHDSGETSQSSSLVWIVPSSHLGLFEAMFGESTEETVWAVSVARTSQPRERKARLYIFRDVKWGKKRGRTRQGRCHCRAQVREVECDEKACERLRGKRKDTARRARGLSRSKHRLVAG